MERKLVMRADKVAFLKVAEVYHRMRGFKNLPTAKNPVEYTRSYVDQAGEVTDVVGMSESKEFEFDQYVNDSVHEMLVAIFEEEKIGSAAEVTIVTVDKNIATPDAQNAVMRTYSVIPDTGGDGTEAYTYSGRFAALTPPVKAKFTIAAGGLTATEVTGV